jgi:hypothetical protein
MVVRAAAISEPPVGYVPPFTAGQFSLVEHFENARRAVHTGLLDGLQGVGPGYEFTAPATRGECAQILHNLLVKQAAPSLTE